MELNNGEKSKHGINLQNSLEDTLVQLKYKNYIKDYKKGLYTKSGAWKNSSPGFQFLYTKRQIPNIIKV